MEKAERTQIHQMIKEVFNSVNSITVDKDGKKFIKCMKQNKKSMYYIGSSFMIDGRCFFQLKLTKRVCSSFFF